MPWRWTRQVAVAEFDLAFALPDELVGGGSRLVLEGLSWRATVTVNGTELPSVEGWEAPVRVPVGAYLLAGDNLLHVRIEAPVEAIPKALVGGAREALRPLATPPRLELMPALHVEAVELRLRDGQVSASVMATGGASVELLVARDGEVLQRLGTAALVDGSAELGPVAWRQAVWGPREAAGLYQVVALLRDEEGRVLDRAAQVTGVRELLIAERTLVLNQEPTLLLGPMLDPYRGADLAFEVLGELGLNLVNVHGYPLTAETLERADELGVGVGVTPRCDGQHKLSERDDWRYRKRLRVADERLLAGASGHPSLVAWVHEGPWLSSPLRYRRAGTDAVVVGVDLPGVSGSLDGVRGREPPLWLVELAAPMDGHLASQDLMASYLALLDQGVLGGVAMGVPEQGDVEGLLSVMRTLPEHVSLLAPVDDRRAHARVAVRGTPRSTVWLEGGWADPVGAVLDRHGEGLLTTWYEGEAVLVAGGSRAELAVSAGTWSRRQWRGEVTEVVLAVGAAP